MIKAIIFDLDGVLVDATRLHYEALNRALGLFGFSISYEDHLARFNGLPTVKKLDMLDLPEGLKPIVARMKKQYTSELVQQHCRPDYQKLTLLRSLAFYYDLACASNAHQESTDEMLSRVDLLGFFRVVVGADLVRNPKPAPDIYLHIFGLLRLRPDECVAVEDAPPGVQAAQASGARVLVVENYAAVHSGLFAAEGLL